MLCLISDQLDPVVKTAVSDRKLLARNGPGVFHPRFSEPGDFQPGDHPGNSFSSFYFFSNQRRQKGSNYNSVIFEILNLISSRSDILTTTPYGKPRASAA